jgi:UDP-galactopyranose mutase
MDQWDSVPATLEPRPVCAASDGEDFAPFICFSHLRWDFVFQRPQHLMTRAARSRRVFFWEEPLRLDPSETDRSAPGLNLTKVGDVMVATPLLPTWMDDQSVASAQRVILDQLVTAEQLGDAVLWYYTPAALSFSDHLTTQHVVVYDCMDELSAFLGADPSLPNRERALLDRSDIVFTGGFSLYEAKRHQHNNVHPFPSGVDVAHFRPARSRLAEPADQRGIPHPRLGFYGVIDERLDTELLAQLAVLRPEWQIVLVGPTVKVDPAALPQAPNIHYLGGKSYADLPSYLSGWDVALMPFARNEATRFISPTKTPEYLAGGKPVVSTPITDVVRQYGQTKAVRIAGCPTSFAAAVTDALRLAGERGEWLAEADEILATTSWNDIWSRMAALIEEVAESKGGVHGEQARAQWA